MPITIIYFDDQTDEHSQAARLAMRLGRRGLIKFVLFHPPADINDIGSIDVPDRGKILENPPDLFLVDQDLNMAVNYFGSTLVAQLRSKLPEIPIVLITRRSILRNLGRETSRQLVEEMQTFDELVLKDAIDDNPEIAEQELLTLADGFLMLRQQEGRTWSNLVRLIKADEGELDRLREASPPLHAKAPGYEDTKNEWTVTGAAHWLRDVVIAYPGILYDSLQAATRLRISERSFLQEGVQQELDGSQYEGIFAPIEKRWWSDRLLGLAQSLVTEQFGMQKTSNDFAEAYQRKHGSELEISRCVWDGSPSADQMCYILKQPVKTEHSLRYYPDTRPSVMDPARVSFRAIRESSAFDEELLDSRSRGLLSRIQNLPDPKSE
jgi:hypothetical protein